MDTEIVNDKENVVLTEAEVVEKVLQFAKLELKYLNPNVQQVYFDQQLQNDDLKLVELNQAVTTHVENGGKLIIKGNDTDNCVMCTEDQTFEVKDTEISNSLLLVPGLNAECERETYSGELSLRRSEVAAVSHNYLELRPIRPKMNAITALLSPSTYEGPEYEENVRDKFTMDDLLQTIAASDLESHEYLKSMNIVELDGFVRLIDFDYLSRVIGSVTALLDENSWHFDSFSRKETLEVLKSLYPAALLDFVLKSYGAPQSEECGDMWSLSEDKVRSDICKHLHNIELPGKHFSICFVK